jgi:hypothetical protein
MQKAMPKVYPPKIEPIWIENYNLSNIKHDFKLAAFERRINADHVSKMVASILSNRLHNIVLHAIKGPEPRSIIDGQHRLTALTKCHKEHGLERYNIMLILHEERDAPMVYRMLNIGKKLTMYDHSKAADDGKVPLFNELKPWLGHHRQYDRLAYMDVLFTLNYAKNPMQRWARIGDIDRVLAEVTDADISFLKTFLRAMSETAGNKIYHNLIYKMAVYRNVSRLARERDMSFDKLCAFISKVQQKKDLEDITRSHNKEQVAMIYEILKNLT